MKKTFYSIAYTFGTDNKIITFSKSNKSQKDAIQNAINKTVENCSFLTQVESNRIKTLDDMADIFDNNFKSYMDKKTKFLYVNMTSNDLI